MENISLQKNTQKNGRKVNGMKKLLLIFATVLTTTMMWAGLAAANTHTGFTIATEACGSCHTTHSGKAAKLLNGGPTQTAFCYGCHDALVGSPYNVEGGMIKKADASSVASYAGAFDIKPATVYVGTSKHNVEDLVTPGSDLAAGALPGNATATGITGGLTCGSCHDPHGDNTNNNRLLRNKLLGVATFGLSINLAVDADNLITKYDANLNAWCGGCHGKFNKAAASGHTIEAVTNMYRHAMGVAVAVQPTNITLATGTPLSDYQLAPAAGKNKVVCLSCHRAHGTDATSTTTWNRDQALGGTSSSTALLRMNARGVCYNCHGAASQNGTGL